MWRRPGRTLGSRIVWSATLVCALAMVVVIGVTYLLLIRINGNALRTALDEDFDVVASSLTTQDGKLVERPIHEGLVEGSTYVFTPEGHEVSGQAAIGSVHGVTRTLSTVRRRTLVRRNDRLYRAGPVRDDHGAVIAVVVVSEPVSPYENTQHATLVVMLIVGAFALLGVALVTAWSVRRTLVPVGQMSASAQEWSEHDLDTRFDTAGATDEIAGLGQTLNLLLDRVASAIRTEQRLTSELAHELRTPLTGIRGEAELGLLETDDPATVGRLERIIEQVDGLGSTITTLVAIARDSGESGRWASAESAVAELVEHFTVPPGVRLEQRRLGPDTVVLAGPFSRALAPLLDNALRYADSLVTVETEQVESRLVCRVIDDGPGIDDAEGSTGLGLPLARRIASSMGGAVVVRRAAGPTIVELVLPRR